MRPMHPLLATITHKQSSLANHLTTDALGMTSFIRDLYDFFFDHDERVVPLRHRHIPPSIMLNNPLFSFM